MTTITKSQIQKINVMLQKAGVKDKDDKRAIIHSFTAQRETSTSNMMKEEAITLIKHLESLDPSYKAADKMRKKILSMAHECGWRIEGTTKIDMRRVNAWCKKYGYLHKKLDEYTFEELPRLVTQFEGVYTTVISKL